MAPTRGRNARLPAPDDWRGRNLRGRHGCRLRFTPFDTLMLEMEIMHKGGYSAMHAIQSATGTASDVIGCDGIGKLTPGRPPMCWWSMVIRWPISTCCVTRC